MRRLRLSVKLFVASLFGSVLVFTSASPAFALSGGSFRADRIIDDAIFFNNNQLSAADIQNFLNSKVPTCDTWHSGSGSNQPPFVCLKDYHQDLGGGRGADAYCPGALSGGAKSAAQIIKDVANACQINPAVLLVLLQKEQSLVTDTWPWATQYERATGYYCPDDPNRPGWCDPEYAGFFNQVWYAARQFQRYIKQSGSFNYAVGRTSFVSYQANNPGCGGTNLTMQTQATAALYNYTPYQPNQAALNNLYGTGDGCSAYGNRNFWRIFSDWFGTTYNPDYSWQLVRQYVYTDSTKTAPAGLSGLLPGDRRYVGFVFKNTGNVTWTNNGPNPIKLGTSGPLERSSAFKDTSWPSATRAATLKETSVAPGEIGTFEFWITAPQVSQDSA
ncbi:hypothetical protein KC963_04920, partial [Candidatus Saccharibacteria bacterium]|nr:hypothetical protein [Candidatus Saccharibacteria bacterium]